ncbi:MAG: DNA recombination protein RmuC [Bacteriovoracaceae bacterium]|nr:DNA recombination protein RmuC [Bacteriovoracaceae bacterium]
MEMTIIITFLAASMVINVLLLFKFFGLNEKLTKEFFQFRDLFKNDLNRDFDKLCQLVERQLEKMTTKVKESLDENLRTTHKTFTDVVGRLAKIDEAQKKLDHLSTDMMSLQDILTDKKSRGIFGEVQLHSVLSAVFGDKNDKIYRLQYQFSNRHIADAVLFLPEPTGTIAIDSKFPLENYNRMYDKTLSDAAKQEARREFKKNLKAHIDAIASKYIIPNETSTQAMMFLPAEALFAELYAYHSDIVDYAQSKKVWATSPTTLMAVLTTMHVVLNEIERSKYSSIIHDELNKLSQEFRRYKDRWDKLAGHIDNLSKDVHDIHITSNKITDRFEKLAQVDLQPNEIEM